MIVEAQKTSSSSTSGQYGSRLRGRGDDRPILTPAPILLPFLSRRSTTLRALCHLLHSAAPSLSQPLSLHSFRLVYYDSRKDCYAAREVAHNITRISKADLAGRLGSQEAREMLCLASKPTKEDGTARETETNDAGITISQLDLEDGDLLECMILPPSLPSNGSSTGQRSVREGGITARSFAPPSRTAALPEASHRSMPNGSNFQRDIPPHMARGFGPMESRQAPFPPRGPAAGISGDRVTSSGSNGRRW